MASSAPLPHNGRSLGFERMMFFSDAVFAIAITLLVLDLKLPIAANGAFEIKPLTPKLIGFGVSFFVIGRYWMAHHRLFEAVRTYDGPLLTANLIFLASIAFLPFPTSVVAQVSSTAPPAVFYLLSMAVVGSLMVILTLVARRPALMAPGQSRGATADFVIRTMGPPVVFLIAAALAVSHPGLGLWLLLSLIPAGWVVGRLGQAVGRRVDAAQSQTGAGRRPTPPGARKSSRARSSK
jgi:uncharacterized membrane protein